MKKQFSVFFKGFYLIAFFIAINFSQSLAFAGNSCGELSDLWFGQYLKDFQIDWSSGTGAFGCKEPEGILALALSDLQSIRYREDSSGYAPEFYKFFTKVIKKISYNSKCKVLATTNSVSGTITLCPHFFDDSREDRVSTLVHEMRHAEPNDPAHVTCVGGRNNGEAGQCDAKFFNGAWDGSGYNADIYFYGWTLSNSLKNELRKDVIQSYVNAMIPDRFNVISPQEIKSWREK